MSSNMVPVCKEFVLKWRIEDFNMCPFENNEFVKSPDITLKSFYNTTWYLKVCPREAKKKNDKSAIEYISCYLVRANTDNGPRSISINYKISVNCKEKKFGKKNFVNEKGYGDKFLERESRLICCELLDIECYMCVSNNYSTDVEKHVESTSTLNELTETKLFPSTQELQDSSFLSNRSIVHSKISVEKRSFICPIKDIDRNLPTLYFMEDRNFTATLRLEKNLEDSEDYLAADIVFKENINENLFLVCSMQIIDSKGEIYKTTEDEFLFTKENEVWHFAKPFLWNEVIQDNNSHLCFEFSVSDGQIRSNLEWLVNVRYHPKFSTFKYLPKCFLKEMFRFYKQSRYCDVTLMTIEKEFPCHKTVLGSQSLVFAAMFKSDMINFYNQIIPIIDFGTETVIQLINFMYTSKFENSGFRTMSELYRAAEMFEIDSLKRICGDFFKNSLNRKNVCEYLLVSHERENEHLKQLAVDLISVHKKEILKSSQWEALANVHVDLAYETLMKLDP